MESISPRGPSPEGTLYLVVTADSCNTGSLATATADTKVAIYCTPDSLHSTLVNLLQSQTWWSSLPTHGIAFATHGFIPPSVAYRSVAGDALAAMPPQTELADQGRMLIWRAWLSPEVASVSNAVSGVTDIAKQSGGYVETQSA